jgi:hypothetical protein
MDLGKGLFPINNNFSSSLLMDLYKNVRNFRLIKLIVYPKLKRANTNKHFYKVVLLP